MPHKLTTDRAYLSMPIKSITVDPAIEPRVHFNRSQPSPRHNMHLYCMLSTCVALSVCQTYFNLCPSSIHKVCSAIGRFTYPPSALPDTELARLFSQLTTYVNIIMGSMARWGSRPPRCCSIASWPQYTLHAIYFYKSAASARVINSAWRIRA